MNTFNSRQTVAQEYQIRISQALALADAALDVAGCEGIEVKPKYVEALKNEITPLRNLLSGNDVSEFKIGVVGLEGAGKSTFINSWLGFDILPSDIKQCTYAATQIRAAVGGNQRLEIALYSADEIENRKRKLFAKSQDDTPEGRKAKHELDLFTKRAAEIEAIVEAGGQNFEFREFSEVKNFLYKYVSDPACALAVKEVALYTNHLDELEGIVLYDVPSLNAGLGTDDVSERGIIRDCDLLIVVQDARTPSVTPSEKFLAKYLQSGDENVSASERIFVFLNGADRCDTKDICLKNWDLARKEWKRIGNVPPENVVMGSALLGLFASGGYITEQTRRAHGDDAGMQEKCEFLLDYLHTDINSVTEKNFGEAVDEVSGVSAFRAQIKAYLRGERVAIFRTKCESAIFEVQRLSQIIHETATKVYSDNVETARRRIQDTWRIDFAKWRSDYVENEIERTVDEAFARLHDTTKANAALFHAYQGLIDEHLNLHAREEAIKARIFSRRESPFSHPESANTAWRRDLSSEIKNSLDRLSEDLAENLYEELSELLEAMQVKLWNDPKVVEIMIGTPELYRARLKAGIDALITRYSRPLIEATVTSPRDTKLRDDVKTKLRNDLLALSNYAERSFDYKEFALVDGEGEGRMSAILSLRGSSATVHNGETSVGTHEDLMSFVDRPGFAKCLADAGDRSDDPKVWFSEMEKEVKDDLAFMESYLRREIFLASGVTEFREQEFRRLREKFTDYEAYWEGIIDNAYERQDPELLKSLPTNLKADEHFSAVASAISNLKAALTETVISQ